MTMRTIRGPAIFLAQFPGDEPPFNTQEPMVGCAADLAQADCNFPRIDPRP